MTRDRTLTVVVLAGGRSRRMGRDKAFLEFNGVRLLERQIALARELAPAQILLSGRAGVAYGCPGIPVICDQRLDAGPLAAVEAVMGFAMTTHVMLLAVDLPALTSALLRHIWKCARSDRGVIPRTENGWEPLVAVYSRRSLARASPLLNGGERAMQAFIDQALRAGEIDAFDVPAPWRSQFANWNRPGDFGGEYSSK